MNPGIYLRRLTIADAHISCNWRNNPEVWKYTNFNLAGQVTHEIEENWLREMLKKDDQQRFGICLTANDQYIGNIQLINIKNNSAELHLVIGEMAYWGKGIGNEATRIILDYAFFEMCLAEISLTVDPENLRAVAIYSKQGFVNAGSENNCCTMQLTRVNYLMNHPNYVI